MLGFMALACFDIPEILVRLFVPQVETPPGTVDPPGLTISDSELGSALKPNLQGALVRGMIVRTNSTGLLWPSHVDHTTQLINAFANDLRAKSLPHEFVISSAPDTAEFRHRRNFLHG